MKKTFATMLCLTVLVLALGGHAAAADKTITMKFGHFAPANHPGNQAAKMFAEAVDKRPTAPSRSSSSPTTSWAPLLSCSSRRSWAPST